MQFTVNMIKMFKNCIIFVFQSRGYPGIKQEYLTKDNKLYSIFWPRLPLFHRKYIISFTFPKENIAIHSMVDQQVYIC